MQREEAKHRQRHGHKQRREQRDDPGLLEQRLRLLAGGRKGHAGGGVGEGHAQHIGQRQRKALEAGHVGAVAGDDAGDNGHHGQHAGRERQA